MYTPLAYKACVTKSKMASCNSRFPSGFLHVKISVKLLRAYTKWSLVLKHVCAGGGNVTCVVLCTLGAR